MQVFARPLPRPSARALALTVAAAALALTAAGGASAQSSKAEMMKKDIQATPIFDVDPSVLAASFTSVVKDAETNVAIGGYDPVSYFGDGGPSLGAPEYEAMYKGAMFRFTSEENRTRFLENPERFAPQYGGYCVKNLAEGKLVAGDPLHWSLDADRLYFTFSRDAKVAFDADRIGFREKAKDAWSEVDRLNSRFGFDAAN